MGRTQWAMLLALLGVACGGRSESEVLPLGPLHVGNNLYDLRIETLADDCDPAFVTGEVGPVVVSASPEGGAREGESGLSIPVPWMVGEPPGVGFSRWDTTTGQSLSIDVPVSGCGAANEHAVIDVLSADSAHIDVEFDWSISGVGTCAGPLGIAEHDCSAARVFHFRWLRSCVDDNDLSTCPPS